jgi:hypothetical protein
MWGGPLLKDKIIELEIGDYCNDFNGSVKHFLFKSNFSLNKIQEAFKIGQSKLGFNFIGECNEMIDYEFFEKNKIMEKLELLGYKGEPGFSAYFDIILFIIKLGNPKFQYKEIKTNTWSILANLDY